MKKIIISVFVLGSFLFVMKDSFLFSAFRSTANLRERETNLDTLQDKSNNLHQLIEELQGLKVTVTSGAIASLTSNTKIIIPGMSGSDTIIGIVRYSSANIITASSITLQTEYQNGSYGASVVLRSKLWGIMGNNISVNFLQRSTNTAANAGIITLNTTGYAIDVVLSTGPSAIYYTSGTALCNAINSDAKANQIVSCSVSGYSSTSTVNALSNIILSNGLGTPQSIGFIPSNYATIKSSTVVEISTGAPIGVSDVLEFIWIDRPDN